MFRFFTSLKLTLTLLLLLAFIASFGTGVPEQTGHYEIYFQSFWFRMLLGLLAINLFCCTVKTIRRNFQDRSRFLQRLQQSTQPERVLSVASLDRCELLLKGAGYAVLRSDDQLLARHNRFGRWGSTLVHLSLLLIMAGAILGEAGFVGTINTYLGRVNERYYDWDAQAELPLGIGLRADSFRASYYPIRLRFDLRETGSERSLGQVSLIEGEEFAVAQLGLIGKVRHFDPDLGSLAVEIFRQQQSLGIYQVTANSEQFAQQANPGFQITNIEFRDPILKQMETEVSIFLGSEFLRTGHIQVNQPLTVGSVSIYQTAYKYHGDGIWSVGFQLSMDPGEPLVWAGAILLVCGLLVVLLLPFRALGIVVQQDGRLGLLVLTEFSGEGGRQRLSQLEQQLNS